PRSAHRPSRPTRTSPQARRLITHELMTATTKSAVSGAQRRQPHSPVRSGDLPSAARAHGANSAGALSTGYRLVDTAAAYRNEGEVRKAIELSDLDHDDVFITTKLSNNDQGRRGTIRGPQRSLKRLGGGSIDLYLIHRPLSARERYVEAWLAEGDGPGSVD